MRRKGLPDEASFCTCVPCSIEAQGFSGVGVLIALVNARRNEENIQLVVGKPRHNRQQPAIHTSHQLTVAETLSLHQRCSQNRLLSCTIHHPPTHGSSMTSSSERSLSSSPFACLSATSLECWKRWRPSTLNEHIRWKMMENLISGSAVMCIVNVQEFPAEDCRRERMSLEQNGYFIQEKNYTTDPDIFMEEQVSWVIFTKRPK